MSDRPQLYPDHQHQWADADQPVQIQGHSHSEPVCAWPDCETYLTPEQMHERRTLVRCTVCGFEAPRNLAKLDGELVPYDGIVAVGPPDPYPDDLQDSRIYDEMPIDDQEAP